MPILGIETSCDDTATAVLDGGRVLAERRVTQEAHRRYLGVVPELASRAHLELLFPQLDDVLAEAGVTPRELDGIAATCGPGLVGCLLVGLSAAKSLAYAAGRPFVGVNHIHAHVMSVFLEDEPVFPFLGLVVSGGHTEFFWVTDWTEFTSIGSTRDDAAGEAFDKVAKLLGLGYPGGVEIDRLAAKGDATYADFPRAMMDRDTLDVSFSGLKTAVRRFVSDADGSVDDAFRAGVAASFQRAVVDVLIGKLEHALRTYPTTRVVVAGGVVGNTELRARLDAFAADHGVDVRVPPLAYCGDNAVMIARTGAALLARGRRSPLSLNAFASLESMSAERLWTVS